MKRGHQQREANYKGSEKEEGVSCVLSGFSLSPRPRKIQTFFFFTNRRLILAWVFNSTDHVSVKYWLWYSSPENPRAGVLADLDPTVQIR